MTARLGAKPIASRALLTGTVAHLFLNVGLALAAEAEGKAPLCPLNATSHWLNGDEAGATGEADLARTGVGLATNQGACLFWALPFEVWLAVRPARDGTALLRDAAVMAGVAALVDYGATPKRFTPGWELVLPMRGMVAAYAAMAAGLAAGSLLARRRSRG